MVSQSCNGKLFSQTKPALADLGRIQSTESTLYRPMQETSHLLSLLMTSDRGAPGFNKGNYIFCK